MSWCNSYTKVINTIPKENSKTQQEKKKNLEANPKTFISCTKCGNKNTTLYQVDGTYYCKEHKPETL